MVHARLPFLSMMVTLIQGLPSHLPNGISFFSLLSQVIYFEAVPSPHITYLSIGEETTFTKPFSTTMSSIMGPCEQ